MKKLLKELKAFLPERPPLTCAAIGWKIGQWLWNSLPLLGW